MKTIDGVRQPSAKKTKGRTARTAAPVLQATPNTGGIPDHFKPHRNRQAALVAAGAVAVLLIVVWVTVLLPTNPIFKEGISIQSLERVSEDLSTVFSSFGQTVDEQTTAFSATNQTVDELEAKVFPQFTESP